MTEREMLIAEIRKITHGKGTGVTESVRVASDELRFLELYRRMSPLQQHRLEFYMRQRIRDALVYARKRARRKGR